MTGKLILERSSVIQAGINEIDLSVTEFTNGIYFLNLEMAGEQILKKIKIER